MGLALTNFKLMINTLIGFFIKRWLVDFNAVVLLVYGDEDMCAGLGLCSFPLLLCLETLTVHFICIVCFAVLLCCW